MDKTDRLQGIIFDEQQPSFLESLYSRKLRQVTSRLRHFAPRRTSGKIKHSQIADLQSRFRV